MDYLEISKSENIAGEVLVSGAKNSALPLIALCILSKNPIKIKNVPKVNDIKTLLKLLANLGAQYEFKDDLIIDTSSINCTKALYDIVRTMRASILVLGPLLARFGHCEVSLPGGCCIGQRPIDLHLKALESMGAKIAIKGGYVNALAKNGLKGTDIVFDKISVTGTENIIMAASLAKGMTRIINAAKEPEVIQLCESLKNAGLSINGIGNDEIEIYGTNGELISLNEEISVIPDRIEAGTYLCAGAITNSKLKVKKLIPSHLKTVCAKFSQMGFSIEKEADSITISPAKEILAVEILTQEYPGFPTDMQAQFLSLCTQAKGVSIIEERLFENRFMHVPELKRLGANIHLQGNIASIEGGQPLIGANVMATDLRASSALVLAGLVSKGTTRIDRIYHLDRGYYDLEGKLIKIGAKIKRKKA